MPRYLIFEKTRTYDYKFKGSSSGTKISTKGIYIAIPTTQFMKYQLNPTSTKRMVKGKQAGIITNWKKPR